MKDKVIIFFGLFHRGAHNLALSVHLVFNIESPFHKSLWTQIRSICQNAQYKNDELIQRRLFLNQCLISAMPF